ncbi:MAG: outer membrane beta-barrel protein [Deltaproteobacteria bacterium]|nr:outer membrane beta-barrel protein [Deltaproteobacteria bacterium]
MKRILALIFVVLLLPAGAAAREIPAREKAAQERLTEREAVTDEEKAYEEEGGEEQVDRDEAAEEEADKKQYQLPAEPPPEEPPFQREIRFGHLALIPSFTLEQEHNDNIYFANGRNDTTELKESDWIRHFKPGLLLDWELNGRGSFKLGYTGDFARYSKNNINDWRTNRYLLDLDYFTPGGLIVKIKNTLIDAQDPYGSLNEYGLGRKIMRWTDSCTNAAGFKFSEDFKVLGFYNFFKQRYADRVDFAQNYTSGEVGAGAEVRVADKTWLFLRAHSGRQNYDTHRRGVTNSNDASFDWKKFSTGLTWDSEARFEGEVNIGYQWNRYENSADRRGLPYEDKGTWVADTSVRFLQSDTRSFDLTFKRGMYQLSSGANGYFTSTTIGLGLSQQATPRILLLAACAYSKNNYSSRYSAFKRRHDPIRLVQASAHYLLSDWLSVGIGYQQLTNGSNMQNNKYRVNQLSFSFDMNPSFLKRRPPQGTPAEPYQGYMPLDEYYQQKAGSKKLEGGK